MTHMERKMKAMDVEDEDDSEEEKEGEEEEEEEPPPPPPPPPPWLWAYKPAEWDDEELRSVCKEYPCPDPPHDRSGEIPPDTKLPPDSITFTLVGMDGKPEVTPRTIKASHREDRFDLIDSELEHPLLFVNYRYVSTNCRLLCEDYVEDTRFTLLLSMRLLEQVEFPEDSYIYNYFIQAKSADQVLDIINFFQFHIAIYFRKKTEDLYPVEALECIRPKFMHRCQVKVHWRKYRKTWTEKRIVVMDPECVAFYRTPFEDVRCPRDLMFFWLEQYRKTICKVARIKSENRFVLQSIFMFATLDYDEESGHDIQEAFKSLTKATPRIAFREPKIFYQWLLGNYNPETGEILPPKKKVQPVKLDPEQLEKLDLFEREMNTSLTQFHDSNDQAQKIWTNIRPQLDHTVENNSLPKVDDMNLNQDPNSVEGLMETVGIIETQLFRHIDYNKALAITVAMRNVYLKSGVERLRELVSEGPVDILHKIHTRGNTSASAYQIPAALEAARGLPKEEDDDHQEEDHHHHHLDDARELEGGWYEDMEEGDD